MSYPGNPSLSAAVKDRVLSTFQQTVALYKQGRTDEVAAGCNLLLQMDPMFDPAKKLAEKLRNPSLPLDVDALLPTPSEPQRAPMEGAREAMAARDFQRVIHLTTEILTDDLLNDEARILGDEAREKLEAAPFVDQFSRKADQNLAAGNAAAAKMELEKARALDPTHPDVVRIAREIAARESAPTPVAPPPSFVVDNAPPPPSGRAASPASDFGFTFEEEKPAEVSFSDFSFDAPAASDFSFQTPAAPPKPPASSFSLDGGAAPAGEFDFATANVVTTDDDQKKIEQYIADGDRAFGTGDYSQAIDLWSRIFLIDVTNDLASERIESAKARRRELEQKVEPLLATGVEAFDRGDSAKARDHLTEVLRIDPRNAMALDYMERIGEATARPYVPPTPSTASPDSLDIFDDDLSIGGDTSLIPPDPGAAAGVPAAAKKSGKQQAVAPPKSAGARGLPKGLLIGIVAVLLLGAGGWFAWSRMSGGDEQSLSGPEGQSVLDRASMLAANGKIDQAIAILQEIKPGDAAHEKALLMIADLRQKKSTSAQLVDGIPAAQYFAQRIAAAQAAFAIGDFMQAKAAYEQAMRVQPLEPAQKAQYDAAVQQASQLDAASALFRENKYAEAINNLQPLLARDPNNLSVKRMIADAHFNIAAQALQEERTADAVRELDEVLALTPDDEIARRSRELAVRYNNETKDLLYRIYVKYLPLRKAT
jgi:tetratricopeptide (TPR) repeat protein